MDNNSVIENLNDILTEAYDAEEGFKKAAERADELPTLESFFRSQSQMRFDFGHELKKAISQYGGTPDKGSSVARRLIRSGFCQGCPVSGRRWGGNLGGVHPGRGSCIGGIR